jgi:uncharacterized short protein YbdD (DUF466 family)
MKRNCGTICHMVIGISSHKKKVWFLKKNKREKSIRPTSKNKHKYKKRNRYKGEGNKQTFLMVKKNKN